MNLDRRRFLEFATCTGAVSIFSGCNTIRSNSGVATKECHVALEQLEEAATKPVLQSKGIDSPLVIDSIQLLRKGREYFVRVRSKDGEEGISVTNSRAQYLYPLLNRQVIPYFIGKDARDLEEHLFGVYRYQSNYKLQGLAFWCPIAWI